MDKEVVSLSLSWFKLPNDQILNLQDVLSELRLNVSQNWNLQVVHRIMPKSYSGIRLKIYLPKSQNAFV